MAVIAGIDEAGFGPVLGPLVVSATVFSLPEELADISMWRLLAGTVSKKVSKRRATVAIADSKDLYAGLRGAAGLVHLERGVLAMLATRYPPARSLGELLSAVSPEAGRLAKAFPWYAQGDLPLPRTMEQVSVALSGNSLKARMEATGISLIGARCEVVFAEEFNRLVGLSNNKSQMLFDVTARLLAHLWKQTPPSQTIRIHVDRQGGRVRYLHNLQRVFRGFHFKIIEETDSLSTYRFSRQGRQGEIHFAVGCENRQLPAALASMISKYLRELFMTMFNAYWAGKVPRLAPTAGYYQDGRRFYGEILPAMQAMGIDQQRVYRSR